MITPARIACIGGAIERIVALPICGTARHTFARLACFVYALINVAGFTIRVIGIFTSALWIAANQIPALPPIRAQTIIGCIHTGFFHITATIIRTRNAIDTGDTCSNLTTQGRVTGFYTITITVVGAFAI